MRSGSPHLNKKGWNGIVLGARLIPREGEGTVRVKSVSKGKLDAKKKAGKSGAGVSRQGREQWKLTVALSFLRPAWDVGQLEEDLDAIDPAGADRGGPYPFAYPGLGPGSPKAVLVKSITRPPEWEGERGSVTIELEEATLAPTGTGAGVGTGALRALSAAERAAIQLSIELLRQRILSDQLLIANGGSRDGRTPAEIVAEQGKMAAEIQRLNKQLEESARVPEAPAKATETERAAKNVADGKLQDVGGTQPQPASAYDPKRAPSAPTAAP